MKATNRATKTSHVCGNDAWTLFRTCVSAEIQDAEPELAISSSLHSQTRRRAPRLPEVAWQALVKRCRKELTFCERVREGEKRETVRFLDQIARAETEQDPLKRVNVAQAHDLLCGSRGPQEKLAFVAIDDDPDKEFVYEAAAVRKEAANIGQQTQEGYKNDDPAAEKAFEALTEHFMERQEELKAPGGEDAGLITYL